MFSLDFKKMPLNFPFVSLYLYYTVVREYIPASQVRRHISHDTLRSTFEQLRVQLNVSPVEDRGHFQGFAPWNSAAVSTSPPPSPAPRDVSSWNG